MLGCSAEMAWATAAGFLIVSGAGGVQSGFRHLPQLGFGNLFRAKAADGVTGEHFFNGGVHDASLLLFYCI